MYAWRSLGLLSHQVVVVAASFFLCQERGRVETFLPRIVIEKKVLDFNLLGTRQKTEKREMYETTNFKIIQYL